ncbi:MAG: hypothetical protein WCP64_07795 [Actinomycetes bacterium]
MSKILGYVLQHGNILEGSADISRKLMEWVVDSADLGKVSLNFAGGWK